jgi:competence protein ComEC
MNGKIIYFSMISLLAVLCSLQSFLLFFFLAVVYMLVLYKYKRFSTPQLLLLIFIFVLFFITSQYALIQNKTKTSSSASLFYLEYTEDPAIDGDFLQIKAKNIKNDENYLLRYKIQSEQEKKQLESSDFYGRICKVPGSLEKPKQAKNENAFNYRNYLERNSVFWLLDSKKSPLETCSPKKSDAMTFLKHVRSTGTRYLETHFPNEVAALSNALIFGDRSLLTPELLKSYQKAGISHLLAISGLHVSILSGMIFFIGIRLGITRESMITFLLFYLPLYAVLTGASPSVIRAVVMNFLVMAVLKWKRTFKLLPIDAISIAFSFNLLVHPFVIYDVGFQLSFTVSGAIILSGSFILQQYKNNIIRMLATTIAAQLSALPVILYQFFGFSLLSILINLLFIPLYTWLFLPGVYLLFFFQLIFGKIPGILLSPFADIVHLSNQFAQSFSDLSFADFTPGRPELPFLLLDISFLFVIFLFWEQKNRQGRMKIMIVLGLLILCLPACLSRFNPNGEVSMIDVGQGDSILIHLPFGRGNYLIDTGGTLSFASEPWQRKAKTFETGKDVVVPFLKGKGITNIDKLILTHGDVDHIGGALAVIKELKVKQIVLPDITDRSETENEIIKEAEKKGIQVEIAASGNQWKSGNSYFLILSPEKNFTGDRNRGSLTVLATIGGLHWFFGGDLDQQGEDEIVNKFPDLSIDVLKVGHHGSKTSSSDLFLMHYQPKIALISVGEKNRFGHPHKEVIDKLTKIHAAIFRTDTEGEIIYHFKEEKGTFQTYLP